ncbi:YfhO family protein [Geobacter argillaceus]|uniref:Membrane protein YfhO n=1 Tax=Geobacter argillaceus TaxID=345631 RepID=A0A562V6E3_9BACT|nr:YfhO family protein [Geobacter argillaceus]TWJ13382.1 membrane protein YfhO [Geobacter argillaceus]
MSERKKDLLALAGMLAILILFFSRILFTDKIVRAPDIINEFLWTVKAYREMPLLDIFRLNLHPTWNLFVNSGTSDGGGSLSMQFLYLRNLLLHFIPLPANIAWFMVVHLFIGAAGVYACCRLIGTGRFAAFFAGTVFALAPENASLINAGHVMKIATISFAPWAFYCFEKGFRTRRTFWFLATAVVLAYQFFNTHWQIAFYTCLCIGAYGLFRSLMLLADREERSSFPLPRLLGMNLVVLLFFLSTVSMSLFPLADWSKDTNRGVQSGANQGKGGLDRDEAMSWSLPPEELAGFVIPGFFGLSRQEAGENPLNIKSYYWGRMVFTQTVSYMGLLPWLLLPLPLIFRRDRYTWLAVAGIAGGILFSMGKYTVVYNLLYDHFPGINRFRVPKMMMFVPVMGLAILAARGIDCLMDAELRETRGFRRYFLGIAAVPLLLLALLGIEAGGKGYWLARFAEILNQPTRYEQGAYLATQRWDNLMLETGIAAGLAALAAGTFRLLGRPGRTLSLLPATLLVLYLVDVGRINDKFLFLVPAPAAAARSAKTPVMDYLLRGGDQHRTLPMTGGDPMLYVTNRIPVLFTSNPVQQQRWQNFLDAFNLASPMPELMNVRYLVYPAAQYAQEQAQLGDKYVPVFQSPDGSEVVLENRTVMPKAWLVPSVLSVAQPQQALGIMQSPQFDPRRLALVESPPSLPMAPPESAPAAGVGTVQLKRYEGEHIDLAASTAANALLVLGEKYYKGWKATVDGKPAEIQRVDYILRGVYLPPGNHEVRFVFDPLPFKVGKYLTLASFALFATMLVREWRRR